jgi:cobalt-zinc-cadmium efflux system outer membrane protein
MRDRSAGQILCLVAILAAGLSSCQTADTVPGSTAAALAARLAARPVTSAGADLSEPRPVPAANPTAEPAPQVVLASQTTGDPTASSAPNSLTSLATSEVTPTAPPSSPATSPSPPVTTTPSSGARHLVADFTVATTVPAVPPASGATGSPSSLPAVLAPAAPAPTGPDAGASAPAPAVVASVPPEPGGTGASRGAGGPQLTLDAAIAVSLERNSTLVSLRAGEPVATAALDVARHFPFNPYVQVEATPIVKDLGGGNGAVLNYVLLMQTLEFAHQQDFREASAAALLNQVRWNIVSAELTNVATTEKLYFTALYQRDLRDLAARTAALYGEVDADVERRFKAGLSKPGEEITARVSLRQSRKQAALAEQNSKVALLALERQLNVERDENYELLGRLEDFVWHPIDGMGPAATTPTGPIGDPHVSVELAQNLASERPDVRAAQAGANVAASNAGLARANVVQNIQAGPYYERDDYGTLFFGFRAQMNLPIWDSGRPLAHQREAEYTQQTINFNELKVRASVEVQTALDRYERARLVAEKERPNLAKSLSEDLDRVKRQFDAGQADILNVFATQTALLQEQKAYLDLLNELAQAAADVTLAAGLPPARLVTEKGTDGSSVPVPPPAPGAGPQAAASPAARSRS